MLGPLVELDIDPCVQLLPLRLHPCPLSNFLVSYSAFRIFVTLLNFNFLNYLQFLLTSVRLIPAHLCLIGQVSSSVITYRYLGVPSGDPHRLLLDYLVCRVQVEAGSR